MQQNLLTPDLFEGLISLEQGDGWVKPWRLPHKQRTLFPSPDDGLMARAEMASGVRLRFSTESTRLALGFLTPPDALSAPAEERYHFDLTIDGKIVTSAPVWPNEGEVALEGLPCGEKIVELWLPQQAPMALTRLLSEDDLPCRPVPDPRPRWVTYGSSLTHCVRAHSPARTWPAIAARSYNLNLTNLGFGGQCHLDPMVGMTIRDLPADLITLKLGINCSSGSLGPRTFPAAVVGLVKIIREKHPTTPIGLISPIGYPPNETQPNVVGYTISGMRRDIEAVHRALVDAGDTQLRYFNGLELFDEELIEQYTEDQCHPDGDGIEIMADHFNKVVMSVMNPA